MLWVSENRRRVVAGVLATVCLLVIGFAVGHATSSQPQVAQAAQRIKTVVQTRTVTTPATRSAPTTARGRTTRRRAHHAAAQRHHAAAHRRTARRRVAHPRRSTTTRRSRRCASKRLRGCHTSGH
jgi:hypothetical protein